MAESSLKQAFELLPEKASESIVSNNFIYKLLENLGFTNLEVYPQFPTGEGGKVVDFAARKNTNNEIFLESPQNPFLILELKGRDVDLANKDYTKTVHQLQGYLGPNAIHCKTAKWGIITNGDYIQLFRKHGKVIYPITQLIHLTPDKIDEQVVKLKQIIHNPSEALTVTVYNNKGGVGKTTTVINLAAYLGIFYKVLVVDFDPNQQDLTNILNVSKGETKLYDCLADYKNNSIYKAIVPYSITNKKGQSVGFDVIPADETFLNRTSNQLPEITRGQLRKVLQYLKSNYDYIFIDAPTNWNFFSQETMLAADVILLPTKHNNLPSLLNAQKVITDFLSEVGKKIQDSLDESIRLAPPKPLPIFYNGENITDAQKRQAQEKIVQIIKDTKQKKGIDLLPYFFPKWKKGHKTLEVYEIPYHAHIATAAFSNIPAVYKSKPARLHYQSFVKEYFVS